jgi:hypothetical protein
MMRNAERCGRRGKTLVPVLCAAGLLGVAYGMARENNPVFLVGLLFVVAGYLLIRRGLKASVAPMEEKGGSPGPEERDAQAPPRRLPGGNG